MRFGSIDNFVLLGGGHLVLHTIEKLLSGGVRVAVFTSPRHAGETVGGDGASLAQALASRGVVCEIADDINDAIPLLREHVTESTLGIALGPAWIFRSEVCSLFSHRLVNFMGIDLPRMRGGAHYTWQILVGDRRGAANVQLINEVVDSGAVVKRRDYLFPAEARTPADYFAAAEQVELPFLHEFIDEVLAGVEFDPQPLQERFSQYFPYLSTKEQGLIDWSWTVDELERFTNAFDVPYHGASTFIDGRLVHLRRCRAEYGDGTFHPFLSGLVYHRSPGLALVACRGGTLAVESATDAESGRDALEALELGHRLHTPRDLLDRAMSYRAVYGGRGLRSPGDGR